MPAAHPLLFPSYIFVLIILQWHKAQRTPGVLSLIMDGERPAKVPDTVIDELKGREVNGLIVLPKKRPVQAVSFRAGDRVRVKTGVFRGLFGLYENQSADDRIKVLMTLFGGPRPVEFAVSDVVKV
jgi:transcriptional antiterminator RfaH